jgi:rhodanese-related sulfurtransferase
MEQPLIDVDEALRNARQRARTLDLSCAGAFTPAEAWSVWRQAPGAQLVDVRTRAEWNWVGRIPDAIEIEWQTYPGNLPNPDFLSQLKDRVDAEALVMFLCRSGVRSLKAARAAASAGYAESYDILEGFEGGIDPVTGQRGKLGGWRLAGLPWRS